MLHRVAVNQPLLGEQVPGNAHSWGKVFALASLLTGLAGLCCTVFLGGIWQHPMAKQPGLVMNWKAGQMARPWQAMQLAKASQIRASTPPDPERSFFWNARVGHAKKAWIPRAQRSDGAVADGPAKVYSGQAQMVLNSLKENPGLFDERVEQQLEALRDQRQEEEDQQQSLEKTLEEDSLILRKRINEVRQSERLRIVKELLYLKVVNKFNKLKMPLIPALSGGDVRLSAVNLTGLTTAVHTGDAMELVQEHLLRLVEQHLDLNTNEAKMPLFEASQVYAMSCFFGYWLRNADERFQLEKLADQRFQLEKLVGDVGVPGEQSGPGANTGLFGEDRSVIGSKYLKNYISSFGPENFLDLRNSVEAQAAIELQVTALFGDLKVLKDKFMNALGSGTSREEARRKLIQAIADNDLEIISFTSQELTRLVLEAVAFGSLLNEAKKQVNSIYGLTRTEKLS